MHRISKIVNELKNRHFINKFQSYLLIFFFPILRFLTILISLKIKRASLKLNLNELIDFIYSSSYIFDIRPMQIRKELLNLLKIINSIKPKFILEIGTASGGTFLLLSKVANSNALLISIDFSRDPFSQVYPSWRGTLYKAFNLGEQRIYLIGGNSHALTTLKSVKKILKDEMLDLLFIDGDHSYNGVKKDFEMYSRLVKKGGIIIFHDICPHYDKTIEVHKYWQGIKEKYKSIEIVDDWNQKEAGIGILYL